MLSLLDHSSRGVGRSPPRGSFEASGEERQPEGGIGATSLVDGPCRRDPGPTVVGQGGFEEAR